MNDPALLPGDSTAAGNGLHFRRKPCIKDTENIRQLLKTTRFFSAEEIQIAAELIDQRLSHGAASGYDFLFAERGAQLLGYSCFGPIPGTACSWDLYWIAVAPCHQGHGVGSQLLTRSETQVTDAGGQRLYIETSSRAEYAPTRAFYLRHGYRCEALLKNFYAPGDNKVVYCKILNSDPMSCRATPYVNSR